MSDQPQDTTDSARKGLEALEEDLRQVREKADDLIVGPDENEGERFYESGEDYKGDRNRDDSDDDDDDQTIAPPG